MAGNNLDAILKLIEDGESPYNNFIRLPGPDRILEAVDATDAVKEKISKESWRLTNAIDVLYRGAGDYGGPGLVCGTYDRKGSSGYVVVLQCNNYREKK